MERTKRKALNFDLDTKKMKELNLYPRGYKLLGSSLKKHGFEHRQGSGYISKAKLDGDNVYDIISDVVSENEWLASCVKKIDVTDIGKQHDLTMTVKELAEMLDEANQTDELDDLDDPDGDNLPKLKM